MGAGVPLMEGRPFRDCWSALQVILSAGVPDRDARPADVGGVIAASGARHEPDKRSAFAAQSLTHRCTLDLLYSAGVQLSRPDPPGVRRKVEPKHLVQCLSLVHRAMEVVD